MESGGKGKAKAKAAVNQKISLLEIHDSSSNGSLLVPPSFESPSYC